MSDGSAPAIDGERVLADLRRLAAETSTEGGAQRLCWGAEWRRARLLLRESLAEIGVADIEVDEAGNLWARLPGADRELPALGVGSHLDSVPDGGWLDGALGVMTGLGLLRAWVESRKTPPRDIVLIDFADEEGARFGRSLFGSGALAGSFDPAELSDAIDAEGLLAADVLAENGVDLARTADAATRLQSLGTWLELHIEQGPVLERDGVSCAAVSGCAGVERHRLRFTGQAAHAGTTPMPMRRDAGLAAAEMALAIERIAREAGGVGTCGSVDLRPGVVTAVAGEATLGVDLRHPEREALAEMWARTRESARSAAADRGCAVAHEAIWAIEPVPFDPDLVALAEGCCESAGGSADAIPSGALHDAAELERRIPAAMIFVPSIGGLSHAPQEDTDPGHLIAGISAYSRMAAAAL